MKKTKTFKKYGYKVIFASKYSRNIVERILEGHIEKALAEVDDNFGKEGSNKTYILEMTKQERDDSVKEIYK